MDFESLLTFGADPNEQPAPSPVDMKKALVAEAAELKKRLLDPSYNPYDTDPALGNIREQAAARQADAAAARERTSNEFAQDFPAAMGRTTMNLVGGTISLASELGQEVGPGAAFRKVIEGGYLGDGAARRYADDRALNTEANNDALSTVDRYLSSHMSQVSQENDRLVAQENALDQAQHLAEFEADIAGGGNSTLATAKRIGKDILAGAGNTLENPTAASNMVVGQVPTLGIGVGAKGLVTGGQITARTALLAEQRGVAAGAALRAEASRQLATRNLTLGVGASEAGGAFQGVAGQILATPFEELAQRYPQLATALAENPNMSEGEKQQLKTELARNIGMTAAAITAPIAAVASRAAANFELAPTRSAAGEIAETAGGRLAGNLTNVAQETLEETIQSGAGTFAGNAAQRLQGDQSADLADGVGIAAGQGAAGGFGMATAFQAPSAAANVGLVAGKAALNIGAAALRDLVARGEANQADLESGASESRAQAVADTVEVADTVGAALRDLPDEVRSPAAATPAGADPLLAPETLAKVGAEPSLDRVSMLGRVISTFENAPELSPQQEHELRLFALKSTRELKQQQATLTTAAENDPENAERYTALNDAINQLVNSPLVLNMEEMATQVSSEQVQAALDSLPDVPTTSEEASPEVLRAVEQIKELAYLAPDKLNSAGIEKVLFQKTSLTSQDQAQLELAGSLAKIREDHEVAMTNLAQQYTSYKSSDIVRNEINEAGFTVGNRKLKSVNEHVRGIVQAVGGSNVQVAKALMLDLARFAEHMSGKASAYDSVAVQAIDAGSPKQRFEVDFKTIGEDGRLTSKKAWVNPSNPNSLANVDAIHLDANTVAMAYNVMAQAYPEVIAAAANDQTQLPSTITAPATPAYQTHVKKAPANAAPPVGQPVRNAVVAGPIAGDPVADEPAVPEENADAAALQQELAAALAAFNQGPGTGVDFGDDTLAAEADLEQALALSDQDYLTRVNPSQEVTADSVSDQLAAELEDRDVPSRAKLVREVNGIALHADGDYLYASDGDRVVGVLGAKASGNEFAVDPAYRGRGIGKLMMRELLTRAPLALSGGLSPAAAATRLAVLRELRAERVANRPPTTIEQRYPGLRTAELSSPNQFLSGFTLKPNAQGLYARLKNPLVELQTALEEQRVADLLPERYQYLAPNGEQQRAMQAVIETVVPSVIEQLQKNLQEAATGTGLTAEGKPRTGKGFLQNLLDGKDEWAFPNRKSLHVTDWNQEGVSYQTQIAEAMALAGVHWVLDQINNPVQYDQDKVLALFPDGVIPVELLEAFQSMPYYEQPLRTLAQNITELLGVQGNNDAPVNHVDGLPKALAADVVRALETAGLLEVVRLKGTTGNATFNFLRWNKLETELSLQTIRNQLGSMSTLTRLLYPETQDLPQIGSAPTTVPARVQGSGELLSDVQRQNVETEQKIPYFRNTAFFEVMDKIGPRNVLRVLGYNFGDLDRLNVEHRRSVEGINLGLLNSMSKLDEIDSMIGQYAADAGTGVGDVPVHYGYRIVSNGRLMMNGYGPQSDKLAREALSRNKALVEFADEATLAEFHLALAQALGVKTEQKPNAAAISEVLTQVLPQYRGVVNQLKQALQRQDIDGEALADQLIAGGINTARGLHALQAFAQMELARETNQLGFEHMLAFELDGKTDGPINALVHFGLHQFNEQIHRQLMQGGLFVNELEKTTLNDWGKVLGDLYGASSARLAKTIAAVAQTMTGTELNVLRASVGAMRDLGHITYRHDPDNGQGSLDVGRSIAKHGVMATVYGSGEKSIVAQLAFSFLDHVYEQLSSGTLTPALQNRLQVLMGQEYDRRSNKWQAIRMPNLKDPAGYQALRFSPANLNALISNLRGSVGGMLTSAINEEMAPVKETFLAIIQASTLQQSALAKAYEKAAETKRQELIAAGTLAASDALSRNQEQEILKGLKHLAPVYALKTTDGLNVGVKDFAGQFTVDDKVQKVASIAGGLSLDINAQSFPAMGVRAAPLMTIALGDATMMSAMFEQPGAMLNVYDGLEVTVGEIAQRAQQVNRAVFDGWQFNAVGSVRDSFARIEFDPDEYTEQEVFDLASKQLRLISRKEAAELTVAQVREILRDRVVELKADLAYRAERIAATKQAINELPVAVDHMSGGQRPYTNAVTTAVTDPLAYVAGRVEEILNPTTQNVAELSPELVKRLESVTENGVAALDATDLQLLLETYPFASKVTQFVYRQVRHLIPANLTVYVGDHAAIAAKQAELFPDTDFGGPGAKGATYRDTMFLKVASEETLIHELVHATTYGLVRRFFNGEPGLTVHQKDAVRGLEALTRGFLAQPKADLDPATELALDLAQTEIRAQLASGDTAAAVNEFLAWTLANPKLSSLLASQAAPKGLKALAKKVMGLVRKALGLPLNGQMESYLDQTLGQFHRLVRRPALGGVSDAGPLFQQTDSRYHGLHVQQVIERFNDLLGAVPATHRTEAQANALHEAFIAAHRTREDFLDAGFPLNAQEQHAFELIQAALTSALPLDSQTLTAMQHLYDASINELTPADFMVDPTSTDPIENSQAQRRLNAVLGIGTRRDVNGRSNLLANFVGMAMVYEPLRRKLSATQMPAPEAPGESVDDRLRAVAGRTFDWLSDAAVHITKAPNQRYAMDLLAERLASVQKAAAQRSTPVRDRFDEVQNFLKGKIAAVGEAASDKLTARLTAGEIGGVDNWVNGLLAAVRGATTDEGATAAAESLINIANANWVPRPVRELIAEMVGITDSNVAVAQLLNRSKHVVARVRQRLRDEVPDQVRALFTRQLDEAQWQTLHRAVGRTDLQVLKGTYNGAQLAQLLTDERALAKAVATTEAALGANQARYSEAAEDLAHWLMTQENQSRGFLYSNAQAMARLLGSTVVVPDAEALRVEPLLDRLVTLKALGKLGSEEKTLVADLVRNERAGMDQLLNLMGHLVQSETAKPNAELQRWNRWKGYIPASKDPRTDLVLASPAKAVELVKLGYRKVRDYSGDGADPVRGLAYYAITAVGGQATYNQGAMQTVEGTVSGVDRMTGRTLDPAVKTLIDEPRTVHAINIHKRAGRARGTHNLRPVFDNDGNPVAYERVLDAALLSAHTQTNTDMAKAIGIWFGRQAEESIARQFNGELVGVLKQNWEDGKRDQREEEYIDVAASKDPLIRDSWNSIPRETQTALRVAFDGPVMVRKDMLNNALGYRSASVADVFTGMSGLPEDTRETLMKAAVGLNKNAYRYLVQGERIWQALVAQAKDWIVVRSGVVSLANGLANQFQLLSMGVPLKSLIQTQAKKVQETEVYLRNERRLAQLTMEMGTQRRPDVLRRLERESQTIKDANTRLSIWPLIEAGELPSIAEGLTEQDEHTILKDVSEWVEKKMANLPPGLSTAARYAIISKDTALYQGLNRMIQFGDFMAKATLYDHMISQGRTQESALREINESFVNYNLLAGRTRDALESMGLAWFLNYKLRIQKIVLRTLRENPLRFLLAGTGAELLGSDSLISSSAPATNWEYAMGPGQFFRAHDMLMWQQLMD